MYLVEEALLMIKHYFVEKGKQSLSQAAIVCDVIVGKSNIWAQSIILFIF